MLVVRKRDEAFEVADVDLPVPNPTEGVVYTIRPLPKQVRDEITARHTKKELNQYTRRMEPVTDANAATYDSLDYVVLDWRGIVWSDGTPLACTKEHKFEYLDQARQVALLNKAGLLQAAVEETTAESFRQPA